MVKDSKSSPDVDEERQHDAPAPEPKITKIMAADLAQSVGVDDPESLTAFHMWLKEEAQACRSVPEVMTRVENSEEAAQGELSDLAKASQIFADTLRAAPNITEHVRLSYAKELAEDPSWDEETEARRRLDRDLKGTTRLFAAIEAANHRIAFEKPNRPHLVRLRKAAEHLAEKYEELSCKKFHFSVPQMNDVESIWKHPHTSVSTKFVVSALKIIFPKASDANIKGVLEEMQRPHPGPKETS